MQLLVALAQARGEDMVLPTIQMLLITVITRLLLLIPLIILLVVTTLITLTLKTGT